MTNPPRFGRVAHALACQNQAVTEAEFLDRMDRHLAVANEHMACGNEHMARGNEVMLRMGEALDRNKEALDRNNEAFEMNVLAFESNQRAYADSQRFMLDLTNRHERVTRRLIAEIRGLNDLTHKQSDALMNILDRLEDGPSGSG